MSVSEIRIGVIGAGARLGLVSHAQAPHKGTRLVAAADVRAQALARFQDRFGADVFVTSDYRQLLDRADIDAVFILSPDFLHEQHAIAALEAGKAVYLEKPMAITVAGCDRILQTARRHHAKLYLGHNMRHFPVIRKMKELIDAGAIGQVKAGWCRHFVSYGGDAYFKDWHAERQNATGLLLQKGAHDIDILHWLCSGYTRRVTAIGALSLYNQITDRHSAEEGGDSRFRQENWPPLTQKNLNPIVDVEDLSMMLMTLDNGVLCSYQQCHYTPDAWRNYTIIGTQGRIENFGDVPGADTVVRLWNQRADTYKPQADQEFRFPPESGGHGGADARIIAEFIRYIREGGQTDTSPIAARQAVAAGCQATASLRDGGTPMEVPPVAAEVRGYFE
jgi:predicted dehydrogenase